METGNSDRKLVDGKTPQQVAAELRSAQRQILARNVGELLARHWLRMMKLDPGSDSSEPRAEQGSCRPESETE